MGRFKPLKIAGEEIPPGETRDLKLKLSESYLGVSVNVPMRVFRAAQEGPRVFLTGGIHGDELTGVGIIRELLYEKPPNLVKGALICVPVVNIFGLERHSRYLPDRRDLNRCFPGSPSGNLSSRLAHVIFTEVVSQCDCGIDFHSAAVRRSNFPNVRADTREPAVAKLARAFGAELVIHSRGPKASLRRAAVAQGVPTIVLEGGEVWRIEPGVVASGIRGCLNVLKSLGMMEGEPEPPLFQIVAERAVWVRAERGGFLNLHARAGDLVVEGQALATNYNIFGRQHRLIRSPVFGIILGMTTMPAVKPGDPIYHIAILTRKTYESVHRRVRQAMDLQRSQTQEADAPNLIHHRR